MVGSCCRTFPSHIAAVVEKVKGCPPRALPELPNYPYMQLSGLEPCLLKPDIGFHWFGERCHLMSPAKCNKLVDAYTWEEVFSAQSKKLADVLDSNFESDLVSLWTNTLRRSETFCQLCLALPSSTTTGADGRVRQSRRSSPA